jgi:hypothetical protein
MALHIVASVGGQHPTLQNIGLTFLLGVQAQASARRMELGSIPLTQPCMVPLEHPDRSPEMTLLSLSHCITLCTSQPLRHLCTRCGPCCLAVILGVQFHKILCRPSHAQLYTHIWTLNSGTYLLVPCYSYLPFTLSNTRLCSCGSGSS